MLTEETIKQTRFFRGNDEKTYLLKNVRSVKLVTLIDCESGEMSDLLLGDDVCSQFVPYDASFSPFIKNQVVEKVKA